ncbi:hypothetical protein IM793_02985 [Pedobacter sp. MR2016-19]|uniref:hypothetical protein n=1 Tax=Pedobacter sp. MR2016-19 TaxID=2780089 RepID=UPI0018759931|nr:hypothetical protein [Pedobacter sp. MR2016-19]MBE5318110.1 hypothetical protein [Pedobacter sp. MR2016-19]
MQTFKYFEQEGNTYKLKVQKGLFYTITFGCVAAIIAILIYSTSRATFLYVTFFALIGLLGILRTTGLIAFDQHNREIQRKRFSSALLSVIVLMILTISSYQNKKAISLL